ncbi:hypothetical protein ASL20_25665 [Cupriavidus necator]|uniref:NAD(P)/FAD-dependent oxidoreductase n=1 Tax=Cupriavidus TaxID=106589 RepID=UPI00033116FA|nr:MULTISPECIES: FAD-dependent oxidoreductase [Cupriavidus]EON18722.1 D-amino acid dehydrogenase small subunit [Cupriavidus sp. GA3-3]KUE85957.1 hypothetical protein ASL20_25665 [Cupriavidus necator]
MTSDPVQDDVVVIGAGIIGATAAYNLVQQGRRVTIIDRQAPGYGCSFGNAGGLSPGISFPLAMPGIYRHIPEWLVNPASPVTVLWKHLPAALPWLLKFLHEATPARSRVAAEGVRKMMRNSLDDYAPIIAFAGAEDLVHHVGQLYLYSTDEGFQDEQRALRTRTELGIEQRVLSARELREYEPALSDIFRHAIYFPGHGHCSNPQQFVERIVRACVNKGGARLVQQDVIDLRPGSHGVRVRTSGGERLAGQVVIAAGIHSKSLVQPLGWRVPLESHRGYHLQVSDTGVGVSRNVMWAERKTLVTPINDGLRVAGTAEIGGLHAAPTRSRFDQLLATLREVYPDARTEDRKEWMGHRPCTPDSLPVLGPLPGNERIICAFGHGHIGLTAASFTGRAVALAAANSVISETWREFSISRFA